MGLLQDASLIVTPNAYKAGKLYSVVPSDGTGDFTVTRATSATRVNSLGLIETVGINVPRLDYTNASCPSILVEQQRTNLFTYSEEFNNSIWLNNQITILANTSLSPSNIVNADKLVLNNTTAGFNTLQNINVTSGVTYTMSCYFKKEEIKYIQFTFGGSFFSNAGYANFDLETGTVSVLVNGTAKISQSANGYWRCEFTNTATSTGTGLALFAPQILPNASRLQSVTNTGANGLYIWGAQLEAGGNATSYIPTTTAAVTRNVDVIAKTSATHLIGQTEGTVYWEGYIDINIIITGFFPRLLILGDGGITTLAGILLTNTNVLRGTYTNSLGTQALINFQLTTSKYYKIAFAYKQNDFVLYVDGVNRGSNNNGITTSTLSIVALGRENGIGSTPSIHPCKTAALWKTRLTDTQLQQLTTL